MRAFTTVTLVLASAIGFTEAADPPTFPSDYVGVTVKLTGCKKDDKLTPKCEEVNKGAAAVKEIKAFQEFVTRVAACEAEAKAGTIACTVDYTVENAVKVVACGPKSMGYDMNVDMKALGLTVEKDFYISQDLSKATLTDAYGSAAVGAKAVPDAERCKPVLAAGTKDGVSKVAFDLKTEKKITIGTVVVPFYKVSLGEPATAGYGMVQIRLGADLAPAKDARALVVLKRAASKPDGDSSTEPSGTNSTTAASGASPAAGVSGLAAGFVALTALISA